MSNFIERELEAMLKVSKIYEENNNEDDNNDATDENFIIIEPKVIFRRPFMEDANDEAPAAKYIKPDTKEYYYLSSNQYTVRTGDESTDLSDILTEEGKVLFDESQDKFKKGEYKDTFTEYCRDPGRSGFWSADESSKYFDANKEVRGCLNSWNNVRVTGISNKCNECMTTSPVIFITENWCLTRSGSLYKLDKNSSKVNFYTGVEQTKEELEEKEQEEEIKICCECGNHSPIDDESYNNETDCCAGCCSGAYGECKKCMNNEHKKEKIKEHKKSWWSWWKEEN